MTLCPCTSGSDRGAHAGAQVGAYLGTKAGSKYGGPFATGFNAGLGSALGYVAGSVVDSVRERSKPALVPDGGRPAGDSRFDAPAPDEDDRPPEPATDIPVTEESLFD